MVENNKIFYWNNNYYNPINSHVTYILLVFIQMYNMACMMSIAAKQTFSKLFKFESILKLKADAQGVSVWASPHCNNNIINSALKNHGGDILRWCIFLYIDVTSMAKKPLPCVTDSESTKLISHFE